MATGDQEEVYTLLLTDIDNGVVDDDIVKEYYHDHLLRSEIGKVISVDFDQTKTSAIVKVKVKAATAASLLEEIQGNLKTKGRVETVHCLYSETFTLTLNWNASMRSLTSGIIPYAKAHYPAVVINGAEGVQTTISGTVHDVLSLQHQYNRHMAKSLCSHELHPSASVSLAGVAASFENTASNIKEYGNLNPDVLALLEKLPEGKIPGVHYNVKGGCIMLDNCTSEEESVRISMFQTKYHELSSSYKTKVDAVEIPDELSDHAVKEMISKFDVKYSQCVFVLQEDPRTVRVISKSSRQFEQAKKILRDNLNQASNEREIVATSGRLSDCMTIPIAGGRKLTLKKANIVLEEVDIIVNAANGSLDHGAGVAGAINRASNGEVQKHSHRYIKKHGKLFAGQVAVTQAGGSLKCKQIIHAVGPTKSDSNPSVCERLLREVMKKVLEQAEKYGAQSISVPAISAGIFGVGADLVAKSIVESILSFKFRKSLPILSDIRIVIIDQPTHRSFAQLFAARIPTTEISPETRHRSLSQPTPVTTSPALSSTGNGLLSTNTALSSTDKAPLSSSSEVPSASNTLTSSKGAPPSSTHSTIIVGVTNARPSVSMAPVWPSTNSASIATASSPSTNIVSWPSTHTVRPSLPPTDMLGVVPSSPSTSTVPPGSWTYSSAVASASTLTSTAGMALSTSSASPYADGAPFSLPAVSDGSYSSPLASTAGAPLSLPAAVSTSSSLSNLAFPLTGEVSIAGSSESSGVSTEVGMKLSFGKDAPIIRPLLQNLSEKWYILGALLGFDQDALNKIASVAGSVESYLEQVITRWLCGDSAKPPTLESLIGALTNTAVGGEKIATKLLKAYNVNSDNVASVELIREPKGTMNEQIILPYLPMISRKWRVIGILLGVSHEDLANIHGEPEDCTRKVISLWLSGKCSTPPTVESLTNALRNHSVKEYDVAKAIEEELLKKIYEKDEDGSGIQYPSLPPFDGKGTDEESTGENRRLTTTPPPGFSRHGTSGVAPLVRSLSDSHSPPLPSMFTSQDEEQSSYRTADSHSTAATGGVCANPQLATAYNLNIEHGMEDKMEITSSAPSDHKRRSSRSKVHHGDKRSSKAKCATDPTKPETTETCVVCLEDFKNPVITTCGHKFCKECILKSLDTSPYCPICKVVLRSLVGHQPDGKMNTEIADHSLPGYEGYKTFKITYIIPDGIQGPNHPNPGMRYTGATRYAYLPATQEGQEVLMLLQKAFEARLIFTVGRSVTTGADNTVVWNDIHHKTNPRGGAYGYPDATYLQRVKEDLAAKGIVLDYSNTTTV